MKVPAGESALFWSKEDGGWKKVSCQGMQGYIKSNDLRLYGDKEALDGEFAALDEYFADVWREIKTVRQERIQELLWAAAIIFLAAAIAAAQVVSRKEKRKKRRRRRKARTDTPNAGVKKRRPKAGEDVTREKDAAREENSAKEKNAEKEENLTEGKNAAEEESVTKEKDAAKENI